MSQVLIKCSGYSIGVNHSYKIEINNMDDYNKMIQAHIRDRDAWANGVQFMKNGEVLMFAYNKRKDFLDYLINDPSEDHIDWVDIEGGEDE